VGGICTYCGSAHASWQLPGGGGCTCARSSSRSEPEASSRGRSLRQSPCSASRVNAGKGRAARDPLHTATSSASHLHSRSVGEIVFRPQSAFLPLHGCTRVHDANRGSCRQDPEREWGVEGKVYCLQVPPPPHRNLRNPLQPLPLRCFRMRRPSLTRSALCPRALSFFENVFGSIRVNQFGDFHFFPKVDFSPVFGFNFCRIRGAGKVDPTSENGPFGAPF